MRKLRAILLSAAAAALSGCQQAPQRPPEVAPAPAAPSQATAPSAVPPAPAPAPVSPQQAQKLALSAVGMLEAGNEAEAQAELQRALAADPGNKLAQNLMRQISADPVAALGRESFNYTTRPNETLSILAGRFLGDIYSFYILARYNNIAVPRQVAGGQVLRIPGKAPPPAVAARESRESRESRTAPAREAPRAEPTPPPVAVAAPVAPPEPTPAEQAMRAGEAAERGGNLELALAEYRKAAGLNEAGADARVEKVRNQLVQRHSLSARTAFAKQDLDGAIKAWERVLSADPSNETAKLERQRALALKDKARKL